MNNNDIIRRLRYTFSFNDLKMMELFELGNSKVERTQIINWLKKDEDEEQEKLQDEDLAIFLNGLIIDKRGRKEGPLPVPEKQLNNNIILRKFKIALDLRDDELIEIMALADMRISKHELSAFFRKPGQKHYRECKDQFLRNFLHGMQLKYHA